MNDILIGSKCLNFHFPSQRGGRDTDIATIDKKKTLIGADIIEFKPIPVLFKYLDNTISVKDKDYLIASKNMLYTLKCSHLSWDINFGKHAKDVIFLEDNGCILIDELYKELYQYWEVVHSSKKHINLNKQNKDFFKNNVNYIVEHDTLHEKHKFFDKPLYWECKKDKEKAILDKNIFDSWDKEKQMLLAIEEILVIAEERFNGNTLKAIKHLITSLSRGWFNTFVITNLSKIINKIKCLKPNT